MARSTKRKRSDSVGTITISDRTNAFAAEERRKIEYGDFQTPPRLVAEVCRVLARESPATIFEPTCGTGNFLAEAIRQFPAAHRALALDINPQYIQSARQRISTLQTNCDCDLRVADFFQADWATLLADCNEPILILGNPPWVTNAALGVFESGNHPPKENLHRRAGLEALTGKSNFDVSEWMILRLMEAIKNRRGTLAMLCKTTVAQKVLAQFWKKGLAITAEIRRIDAIKYFAAHVDACLFIVRTGSSDAAFECRIFETLAGKNSERVLGMRNGRLVADLAAYERMRHFIGNSHRWRSGIKHDCAAVFELRRVERVWRNGFGEAVELEGRYVFPLLKSSQVASGNVKKQERKLIVPQRRLGEDTRLIADRAPRTWRYLVRHKQRLERRGSAVYRGQPPFSVFGIGSYTFSRWKVMVSGFYKTWKFVPVGPIGNRPVICDDTCYFLPCRSSVEATRLAALLNSNEARDFFSAFVFKESKRPLTAEILGLLDLNVLSAERQTSRRQISKIRHRRSL